METARAVAHAAAVAWWHSRAASLARPGIASAPLPDALSLATLPEDTLAAAAEFGQALSSLSLPEAVATLGGLYTQAIPAKHRAAHGIYYTPPALVRRLLDKAERAGHCWRAGRVIDPSCGGGAFLMEAASRVLREMEGAEPAIALAALGSRLRGWDTDPFAVWLANLAVEAVVNRAGFAGGQSAWVTRPGLVPRPRHSSALRPRREGCSRSARGGGGC